MAYNKLLNYLDAGGIYKTERSQSSIDDIGVEIIAMHYGIGWGERQRVFPQDFPSFLWEYSLSFLPSNTIMHCDFNSDIVYCRWL